MTWRIVIWWMAVLAIVLSVPFCRWGHGDPCQVDALARSEAEFRELVDACL